MKKSDLRAIIKEVVEEINIQEIDPVIKDEGMGQWKTDVPGIKVFFDITGIFGKGQTWIGRGIQMANKLIHGDLRGANHVGFVLSDGRILDAGPEGVGFRDGSEIKDSPQNFIVFNLGGNESSVISAYNDLSKSIKSYDYPGLVRQLKQKYPRFWKLVNRFKNVEDKYKEDGQDKFYCSEFVANLLARLGYISVDELVKANVTEELTALDSADELDPIQLYKLIKSKAKLVDIVKDPQST